MQVYLDESGDTGWNFSAPYRHGGSSRYLCLAFVFLPLTLRRKPRQLIAAMYRQYGWRKEKKASTASAWQKREFCSQTAALLQHHPEINLHCMVAKKENVRPHIRQDANKLYNYMCGLVIPQYVTKLPAFEFIPDKRTIKVESGNSLSDYLQTKLWFDHQAETLLVNRPGESHADFNLQFADWIANAVWGHFEDQHTAALSVLSQVPQVKIERLFF